MKGVEEIRGENKTIEILRNKKKHFKKWNWNNGWEW